MVTMRPGRRPRGIVELLSKTFDSPVSLTQMKLAKNQSELLTSVNDIGEACLARDIETNLEQKLAIITKKVITNRCETDLR
jgi:hypothetical protein